MDHNTSTPERKGRRVYSFGLVAAGAMSLCLATACSQSDTPFVDMCQKITGNLVSAGSISNWDKVEKVSHKKNLQVSLVWSGSSAGTANCTFDAAKSGGYDGSPREVILNGETVPFKKLVAAAAKSSGKIISDSAKETAENTKKLAGEASEKATELAGQAAEVAGTAKERATELAGQASETAGELAGKAREVASEVGDKAREAALDATKAVQEKLEK